MESEGSTSEVLLNGDGSPDVEPLQATTPMDTVSLEESFPKAFIDRTYLESRRISLMALLHSWGKISPEKVLVSEAEDLDLCQASSLFDLDCTYITGSVNLLKALNLPAIMVLNFGGSVGSRYVCLLALEGNDARIVPGRNNGVDKVPLSLLMDYWYGTACVFWKDFNMHGRLLITGVVGDDVAWLQGGLKHLGYHKGEATGIFDIDTEIAVQSFQKDHYLEDDGVLGPQTKIVLYHALKEHSMPTLISQ
jgi:general secretion pathway protein A